MQGDKIRVHFRMGLWLQFEMAKAILSADQRCKVMINPLLTCLRCDVT